jgi:hypothetical protein
MFRARVLSCALVSAPLIACGASSAGAPEAVELGVFDGSYSLTFESVRYQGTPGPSSEFASPGESELLTLREDTGVTHALFAGLRVIEARTTASEITLEPDGGFLIWGSTSKERWQRIVLGRRDDGALNGTFRATGVRGLTELSETEYAVVASGRLARDTEPPNGYLQSSRAMPWDTFTLTFSEPIVKSELEAVEATLPGGLEAVPLLGKVLPTTDPVSGRVDTVFGSAQEAEFRLPVGLSWVGIGGPMLLDLSSVHDLAGLATANAQKSVEFQPLGAAQAVHDMSIFSGFATTGAAFLPAPGSSGEMLCEGAGCVALQCEASLSGLLEVGAASSVTIRHRATGYYVPQLRQEYQTLPWVSLSLIRRGGSHTFKDLSLGFNSSTEADEVWRDEVVPIPKGTTEELAFQVALSCPEGASITWVIDSVGVSVE